MLLELFRKTLMRAAANRTCCLDVNFTHTSSASSCPFSRGVSAVTREDQGLTATERLN